MYILYIVIFVHAWSHFVKYIGLVIDITGNVVLNMSLWRKSLCMMFLDLKRDFGSHGVYISMRCTYGVGLGVLSTPPRSSIRIVALHNECVEKVNNEAYNKTIF